MAVLRRSLRRTAASVVIATAVLCSTWTHATDQQISAAALKAAFLVNFAKFTEWPDGALAEGQTFGFCVIGDRAVASALIDSLKLRPSGFNVTSLKPNSALGGCQLLYIGGTDLKQAVQDLDAAKGLPVFTVGEAEHFAEAGGVAQLVQEKGRMRFAINPAAAQRAHLTLSAKLLNLAILIKDTPNATR